jgi:hypothetical protein
MDPIRSEHARPIIAALMTAEECDFLEAQRIVMDFERLTKLSVWEKFRAEMTPDFRNDVDEFIEDSALAGTIWDGWMARGA